LAICYPTVATADVQRNRAWRYAGKPQQVTDLSQKLQQLIEISSFSGLLIRSAAIICGFLNPALLRFTYEHVKLKTRYP
jgi:hypothetical protein